MRFRHGIGLGILVALAAVAVVGPSEVQAKEAVTAKQADSAGPPTQVSYTIKRFDIGALDSIMLTKDVVQVMDSLGAVTLALQSVRQDSAAVIVATSNASARSHGWRYERMRADSSTVLALAMYSITPRTAANARQHARPSAKRFHPAIPTASMRTARTRLQV